ncbi:FMN-binding protein [Cellulomonas avistercoris]|uniref:FMN-binding protein n=1 Tax=Cellulomonas avistercoris TaxID=2762242 RepID=UPI001CD879DB|nr:FMN-binding protein [Cellulomonas avistercoris]
MPARRRSRPTLRVAAGLGAGLALTGCTVAAPADARPAAEPRAGHTPLAPAADGTYSGSGSYETPGGRQQIDVTVVLADGVVTGVRVDPAATNATSLRFQERFASAVVDSVVGRTLDEVAVDRLAGSSSTGAGFMAALERAVRDARA